MTAAAIPQAPRTPPSNASSLGHSRFEPGTKISARYRIVGMLGRGGMGEVYRADDLELGQSVALKFLPDRMVVNPAEMRRFRNEVKVARQIAHPNVARIYDIGEAAGHVFLSMEYIDGEDLAAVLRRMGRPSTDKALEISRQLCLGVAAAHDAGVLHRDLKPANVMIDGRGRVRITDFGLAGLAEELEQERQPVGTPAYMAPEQLSEGSVSTSSDVYSLGLILYEVFTGNRALETNNIAELKQLQASGSLPTPTSLPQDVDPAVERLVLACLERDPQQRPPSAYAVLGALPGADPLAAALAAGETPSPELVANAGLTGGLRPRMAVALGFAILVLLGVMVGSGANQFEMFEESPPVLSRRAAEILELAGFDEPPRYSAMGFEHRWDVIGSLSDNGERARADEVGAAGGVVFWKRWSPRPLEPANLHDSEIKVNDPPQSAPGSATVILDVEGRLLGLEVVPTGPQDETALALESSSPDWSPLLTAAGLDPSGLSPAKPLGLPLSFCDTITAWTGTLPDAPESPVTVQAGAYRGRLVHYSVISSAGSTTDILSKFSMANQGLLWQVIMLYVVPLIPAVFLARHNLKLGRGDRRGAMRLAVFVAVGYLLASALNMRPSESFKWVLLNLFFGKAAGHALLHGVSVWFYYMALEPYVRRLWPRMLVSWARVISGRVRDPLVGRDLMIGGLFPLCAFGVPSLIWVIAAASGAAPSHPQVPQPDALSAAVSPQVMAYEICGAVAEGVLRTMGYLVIAFGVHLVFKRVWLTAPIAGLIVAAMSFWFMWVLNVPLEFAAPFSVIGATMAMWSLFRFGLLAAVVAISTSTILFNIPWTSDLSSWA
ncbi:MAG: serine/threonine-protein kinase, partial [Planctomycetota bacterium]